MMEDSLMTQRLLPRYLAILCAVCLGLTSCQTIHDEEKGTATETSVIENSSAVRSRIAADRAAIQENSRKVRIP